MRFLREKTTNSWKDKLFSPAEDTQGHTGKTKKLKKQRQAKTQNGGNVYELPTFDLLGQPWWTDISAKCVPVAMRAARCKQAHTLHSHDRWQRAWAVEMGTIMCAWPWVRATQSFHLCTEGLVLRNASKWDVTNKDSHKPLRFRTLLYCKSPGFTEQLCGECVMKRDIYRSFEHLWNATKQHLTFSGDRYWHPELHAIYGNECGLFVHILAV